MKSRKWMAALLAASLLVLPLPVKAANSNGTVNVNVLLNTDITDSILSQLAKYGKVTTTIPELDAATLSTKSSNLTAIQSLSFVSLANPDAERKAAPLDPVSQTDFSNGVSTWNLDALNVTNPGTGRTVEYDGTGTYVAVPDTGLIGSWRQYFPEERIAEEYARSFTGGPTNVATQPNKWENDVNSHGTHVTSTVLGYSLNGTPVNGVATGTTVIPVKVLNQNGSGWSSVIAAGITYIADLKAGELKDHPVVINMSLGGGVLDAVEKAAIDYAISKGVIIVASAGNEGTAGMGYPGAYEPVVSVAAYGWAGQWSSGSWWTANVADPTNPAHFYIAGFSSRELTGQDLDVAAPGAWVVGSYQNDSSNKSGYYYLSGTSMASPHVAGLVALMAEKYPALTQADAERILTETAIPFGAGSRTVLEPTGPVTFSWGADAVGSGLADAAGALAATP